MSSYVTKLKTKIIHKLETLMKQECQFLPTTMRSVHKIHSQVIIHILLFSPSHKIIFSIKPSPLQNNKKKRNRNKIAHHNMHHTVYSYYRRRNSKTELLLSFPSTNFPYNYNKWVSTFFYFFLFHSNEFITTIYLFLSPSLTS